MDQSTRNWLSVAFVLLLVTILVLASAGIDWPRVRRGAARAVRVLSWLTVSAAVLFVGSAMVAAAVEGTPPPTTDAAATPTPTVTVTVTWTLTRTCADGWPSPSIGRRGACSHHGGVVDVWHGSDGRTVVCRGYCRL